MMEYKYELPEHLRSRIPAPVRTNTHGIKDATLLKLNHFERLSVLKYIREDVLPSDDDYHTFVDRMLTHIPDMERDVASQNLIYHYCMMKNNGEKIFTVSQPLAEMLLNTTVKGITGSMLKTPYPELYIEVPRGLLMLTDGTTGEHQMEGMYVHKDDKEIRVLAIGSPNENSRDLMDDCFTYFRLPIEDTDLHEQLAAFVEHSQNDALVRAFGGIYNLHKVPKIFLFLMNILLYITSPEKDVYFEGWGDIDKNIKSVNSKQRKDYIQRLKNRGTVPAHPTGRQCPVPRSSGSPTDHPQPDFGHGSLAALLVRITVF